ncbi:TPA: DUF389 domain-containing protein [Candidatus Micrarchaeota archaeon]|nr:DUF389 domain-containing protein [Candidatus Micrarchaeota archaeon]HIH29942.1 DUF389 domain-containing protein [Candidatus Micrarchaeota archaeon]
MPSEFEGTVRKYFGTISDEEKKEVLAQISAGSNPSIDYFVMLVISALIASIGLLTNSVAAIIGAMLVSPLLLPVIGISLGAVKGDLKLFRTAVEAEAKGIAIVLVLVTVLTLVVPNAAVTSEILLRTHPTPLDLIIALASGAAAAYALSKKSIGAALPGVAIAVAIMPPICVVGIGFALRMPEVALGSALTFVANIVAINFAASAVFWFMNFSPKWSLSAEEEVKKKLKTSSILLLLIFLPLAWIMWDSMSTGNVRTTIGNVISSQLDGIPQAQLVKAEFAYAKSGSIAVIATIDSPKEITQDKADEMRLALEKNLNSRVELNLKVNQIKLVESGQPS